jgi:hypothetical protein
MVAEAPRCKRPKLSNHSLDSSNHDLYVSAALLILCSSNEYKLIEADGNLPFKDHEVPITKKIGNYRPDAVLESHEGKLILEVKSMADFMSQRSEVQLANVISFLEYKQIYKLCIFIFNFSDDLNFLNKVKFYSELKNVFIILNPEEAISYGL